MTPRITPDAEPVFELVAQDEIGYETTHVDAFMARVREARDGGAPLTAEEVRQARKRERILDAATRQFIAHGYRKASVDEIARDAGIAKGTLYLYYRTKAELLVHAVTREKQLAQ